MHIPNYQLAESMELLERARILAALPKKTKQHLILLEIHSVLDSTNSYALQYKGAMPYACLAEYQTAGHGRHGRQWISPMGSGLCLSLKQRVQDKPLSGLNIALAVTVVRVLHLLGATDVGIKWPNDILWQGRKLAGLLLESGKNSEIVFGIGINVKMPEYNSNINQPWVDLYSILGQTSPSRNMLAAKIIEHGLQTLTNYPQLGLSAFQQDWHRFDLSYGQLVTLETPQIENKTYLTGTACGIDEEGALLLQIGNQKRRYVDGEVSLRL
ncbi:MAG: biotin--[acetyl-CoA-carboxylase] ligase [Thiomargarita sp.]|nr:biotin--[acetyl-CoA-carboxylase] ligase [Thiomargarita sp.]